MQHGITAELALVAIVAAALCMLLAMRQLPFCVSLGLTTFRVGVPLLYFAYYFNPDWCILDDLVYFEDADRLLAEGFNPITVLLTQDGYDQICAYSSGHHILYTWFNVLAQYLFGPYYYAPVFFNVALTFASAHIFSLTLAELGFESKYRWWMEVFLLLHWDTVAWSSFINLKDILVQSMTIFAVHEAIMYFRYKRQRHLFFFGATCLAFYWIRYYLPFMLGAAFVIWMISQWDDPRRYLLAILICVACYFSIPLMPFGVDGVTPEEFAFGLLRFSLTPLPWRVVDMYTYLILPSILHLVLALPALHAAWSLWHNCVAGRFWLIHAGLLIVFYAFADELQGPRQRYQLDHVFAWAQFHFFWQLRSSANPAVARVARSFQSQTAPLRQAA